MGNREEQAVITAELKADCFYLRVSKSLHENDAGQLERMFQKAMATACRFLLIDCRNVKSVSIPALRIFLANLGPVQAKGMKMGIFGCSPELLELLKSSGMDALLAIGETEEAVMELLNNKRKRPVK